MKLVMKYSYLLLAVSLFFGSCKDFEELNTNPTKSAVVDPNAQLAYVELLTWGDWTIVEPFNTYCGSFAQLVQGDYNVTQWGGQYRRSNTLMTQTWDGIYGKAIKNLVDVIMATKDEPLYQNVRAAARIYKVYYFMILTDLYGDVPYFDAGKGYSDQIVTSAYDSQELIYADLFKELTEAEASFSADGGTISGDIIYKGNITQWQRLANSLHLRLAMRLTKVNPQLAHDEVSTLLNTEAGFLQATDDAYLTYTDLNDWDADEFRRNALAQIWRGRETYPTPYICATFWNYLRDKNDPRLLIYGRAYDETAKAANDPFNRIDLTDEIMAKVGVSKFQPPKPGFFWYESWPSGYWSNLTNKWQDKACRPQVNKVFLKGNVPGIIMSYAEVQLLLSEVKVRWADLIPDKLAGDYYKAGVTAAMEGLSDYGAATPTSIEMSTFFDENPFPAGSEDRIKLINEQLWVLHFNNPAEAYANWRRSGYPALQPSSTYGAITIESTAIPRRLNYPITESAYNKTAYDAALQKLGGTDNWNKSVWWDKQ